MRSPSSGLPEAMTPSLNRICRPSRTARSPGIPKRRDMSMSITAISAVGAALHPLLLQTKMERRRAASRSMAL